MIADHYATLGIAPAASNAAIRAAYLELMRRYHPDRNPSAAAAARVTAVTAAYTVLGSPERRAAYDDRRARLRAQQVSQVGPVREQPRLAPWLAAALGVAAVALMLPFLIPPPLVPPELPVSQVGGEQARTRPVLEQLELAPQRSVAGLCSSQTITGVIKQELFRRAARLAGGDSAAFDRIAGFSAVRLDSPAAAPASDGSGSVGCTAFVVVDLPPGIAAQAGRQSLTGTIAYTLRPEARRISLTDEGSVVSLLATLAPVRTLFTDAPGGTASPGQKPAGEPAPLVRQAASPARSPAQPAVRAERQQAAAPQEPSFDCQLARSRAQLSVCNSASLAALDRQTASLYGRSLGEADSSTRAMLLESDVRFLARRDTCSSESCVHGAYVGRIREIREISAGGQPPG